MAVLPLAAVVHGQVYNRQKGAKSCHMECFKGLELEESCTRNEDEAFLNGSSLEDDEDIASQGDIDALFD